MESRAGSRRGRSARTKVATGKCCPAPEAHARGAGSDQKAGIATVSADIAMVPKNLVKLEGKYASGMLKLNEVLEEHDDVQNVYSNFDIDESEMEALAK